MWVARSQGKRQDPNILLGTNQNKTPFINNASILQECCAAAPTTPHDEMAWLLKCPRATLVLSKTHW